MSNINSKYSNNKNINDEINIYNEIVDIKNRINNIEVKLDKILLLLETNIEKNCNKMGEHIEFIENVYSNVKRPLEYVCDKVNSMTYLTYDK